MAKASPRHFPPPLKGLEWRESFQDIEGEAITAECLINLETSHGELRERDGFEYYEACPARAQIFATDHPNKYKRLITVGESYYESEVVEAQVLDLGTGKRVTTNLTSLTGERYFDGFRCSCIPVRLPGGNDLAFDANIIVTPGHTYCVLPDGTVRAANMDKFNIGGDTLRDNAQNFSYVQTRLKGPIAVAHEDKVFFMGWGADTQFLFTSTIEDQDILVPGVVLDSDRGSYRLGSDWMMFSDEFSSLDVQVQHCLRTDGREEITGAASFKDLLVIFTDVSMYVVLGSSALDFQPRKIDGSTGCTSHWSIVQANDLLYWMARDGVYAFNGSKVEKVSVGIDQLWSGQSRSGFVPEAFRAASESLGWPFKIDRTSLASVNSVHFAERSLIMWSIPIKGRNAKLLQATLVHDYKHGGFYFWSMPDFTETDRVSGATNTVPGTCMYDAVTVVDGGKETLYTTGFSSQSDNTIGAIRAYGQYMDMPAPDVDKGIPFIWTTGRVDKNVMGTARIQSVRFSLKARGSHYGAADVYWSVYDATTQHQPGLSEKTGDLPMFPPALLEDSSMQGAEAPLFGTGQFGSAKCSTTDYFKSKGGGCRATDGSLRVSVHSTGGDFDPSVRINGWSFEIDRGDTR